jgi:hypothetical protein
MNIDHVRNNYIDTTNRMNVMMSRINAVVKEFGLEGLLKSDMLSEVEKGNIYNINIDTIPSRLEELNALHRKVMMFEVEKVTEKEAILVNDIYIFILKVSESIFTYITRTMKYVSDSL